jgi:3-hydroxyisobutyrate dehydrogenase-like beta-hydroxyacid dehydrogenase
MNIGYIGLGAMGSALAGRFLPAHKLVVWDLNSAASVAASRSAARRPRPPRRNSRASAT